MPKPEMIIEAGTTRITVAAMSENSIYVSLSVPLAVANMAAAITREQVDELHRFLGAFLEEIERAKESK